MGPQREVAGKAERERPRMEPEVALTAEDFLAKALERARKSGAEGSKTGRMADWSDAEVLAALEGTAGDTDSLVDPYGGIRGTLLDEYLKRDFDAALGWFQKQDLRWRVKLARRLAEGWPPERAEEGVRFLTENRNVFTDRWEWGAESLLGKALLGASGDGVEAFTRIIRRVQEAGMADRLDFPPEIAPGFDFAAFMRTEAAAGLPQEPLCGFLGAWFQVDREAAFRWTAEHQEDALVGLLMKVGTKVPQEAGRWMGGQLATLGPAQRAAFLDQMENEWRADSSKDFMPLLEGATDPAVREEIRSRLAQGMFTGQLADALRPVEDIAEPEQRLRFLETLRPSRMVPSIGARSNPQEETRMREKLREWHATDERIEAILRRFKPTDP